MVNRALMAGKFCRLRQPLPRPSDRAITVRSKNCRENQQDS
jgi:hypothetical protein